MAVAWVAERGDIVWLHFNPHANHEQRGRRPALVISPSAYNRKVGLALFCPITSVVKGYPFEVELPEEVEADGAVLADQIRNLDWRARNAERWCTAPADVVEETTARILALVNPD